MKNTCEAVKEVIRNELKTELSFVNDRSREQIADNICNKIHELLDTSEEIEDAFREASADHGW
mgnify:CR=1 FL=1